mmetsp:Transcript_11805/g.27768  ORF Transcript_11805/g.27768 Transcript_11805/m.27768 type:complete len:226 (+) Transcript_11805:863-1540(+)
MPQALGRNQLQAAEPRSGGEVHASGIHHADRRRQAGGLLAADRAAADRPIEFGCKQRAAQLDEAEAVQVRQAAPFGQLADAAEQAHVGAIHRCLAEAELALALGRLEHRDQAIGLAGLEHQHRARPGHDVELQGLLEPLEQQLAHLRQHAGNAIGRGHREWRHLDAEDAQGPPRVDNRRSRCGRRGRGGQGHADAGCGQCPSTVDWSARAGVHGGPCGGDRVGRV